MAKIIQEINLEVAKPNLFQAIVAKQNDYGSRYLKVTFVNNGEKINIDATLTATINAERPDGLSKRFDAVVNDDGTVTAPLTGWMLELQGLVSCDISVMTADGRLTTTDFSINVNEAACSDEDISDDEDTDVLKDLIVQVETLTEEIETKLANGEFNGEQGPQGPPGKQGAQGPPGEQGVSGVYIGGGDMPENYNIQINTESNTVLNGNGESVEWNANNGEKQIDTNSTYAAWSYSPLNLSFGSYSITAGYDNSTTKSHFHLRKRVGNTWTETITILTADKTDNTVSFDVKEGEECFLWIFRAAHASLIHTLQIVTNANEYVMRVKDNAGNIIPILAIKGEKGDKGDTPSLDGYIKNTDYASPTTSGVVKVHSDYGLSVDSKGNICTNKATEEMIDMRENQYNPIVPANVDYAVKKALTDSKITWIDAEKKALFKLLGLDVEIVSNFWLGTERDTVLTTHSLVEGQEYKWSFYCKNYPGWLVNDEDSNPSYAYVKLTSVAEQITLNGQNYIGFKAACFNYPNGSGTILYAVYQDGTEIKVYRSDPFNGDVISIWE